LKRAGVAVIVAVVVAAGLMIANASPAHAATCTSSSLYVVAHEDDALLFQSPALVQDIESGRCVRHITVTAGDAGMNAAYYEAREQGTMLAFAQMAGVPSSWTMSTDNVAGVPILMATLVNRPEITLLFMRLPDGAQSGDGTPTYGNQSLWKLWSGAIPSISADDGSATYSRQGLIDALGALINEFKPQRIAAQDYLTSSGGRDNSDHESTAYFTVAANAEYTQPHVLVSYKGYGSSDQPANVSGAALAMKEDAFYAYGASDSEVCSSADTCGGTAYDAWLQRQYVVGSIATGVMADAGYRQTVRTGATVQLDGSASSDQYSGGLTYNWRQVSGPTVSLSSDTAAKPTFVAPAAAATLTFSLQVADGSSVSALDTVSVVVTDDGTGTSPTPSPSPSPSSSPVNVAPLAVVSASSQSSSTSQTAVKAVDGSALGYPDDYTREWATAGGGVGSWLKLSWSSPYVLSSVVLYDRPNTADQVTSATLTFSDGSTVSVGSLPNDGSPLVVSFAPRATSSLLLTITGVGSSTQNVGLAEIQAWSVG
jgi:LmbE family N-acetylglucosaminyl deacetylase